MQPDILKPIVLKVDVDTERGTRIGVPNLLALFRQCDVKATFLFSLGPDNTGRAIKRIFRPGFFSKVARTSVLSHYGLKTLLNGVLIPGPHIARRWGEIMRRVVDDGHEVGIHCHDHILWQDHVRYRDAAWTETQMSLAIDEFRQYVRCEPTTIGAAGWQVNSHVPHLEEAMGFRYASDTRGGTPFFPRTEKGRSNCLQIPTTLPTMDELIGVDDVDEATVAEEVFRRSLCQNPYGHVYTLHAELEGMKLLPAMQELLNRWQERDVEILSLADFYHRLPVEQMAERTIEWQEISGRSGQLAFTGEG